MIAINRSTAGIKIMSVTKIGNIKDLEFHATQGLNAYKGGCFRK